MSILLSETSSAQKTERKALHDFDFVESSNPWLSSSNAAGLSTFDYDKIASARAFFNKNNGGLIMPEGSDDSIEAGADTKAYIKISDRLFFSGSLSYSNFMGENMGGPLLMDPSDNPVNFYESTDTTKGRKNKEIYGFSGGIAYSISPKWVAGAKINYQAGNSAKRKDPRYLNNMLDMDLSAGAIFKASKNFSAGLNLQYIKTLESLSADIYGTTDKSYYIFVDYGNQYGKIEAFEGDVGYVSLSNDRPMMNSFMGGSVQLAFGTKEKNFFFNEITYLRREGYFGNKASNSVLFSEHSGNIFRYDGTFNFHRNHNLHQLKASAALENLVNNENIYRITTRPGENSIVEYFGSNQVHDRDVISASMTYNGYLDTGNMCPKWEYTAQVEMKNWKGATTLYPFERSVGYTTARIFAEGKRRHIFRNNILMFGIDASYYQNFGYSLEDKRLATSSSEAPRTQETYRLQEEEYIKCPKISAGLTLRYTKTFGTKASGYIEIRDCYMRALSGVTALPGIYRNLISVTVGGEF